MAFGLDDALIAAAGSQVIGGLMGSDAAKSAAGSQANAANNATATNLQMFNTVNQQAAPYRQAGVNALSQLFGGTPETSKPRDQAEWTADNYRGGVGGTPGLQALTPEQGYQDYLSHFVPESIGAGKQLDPYFTHQFGANDLNASLAPNYQFQLDQGLGALKNAGNLQTGLISGNTLKGINDYAQNYAGGAYQQAYNNYTSNQNNIFTRLSTIAGYGQNANQTSANAGTTLAGNIGNAQMAAGAANAAGTVGSANALTGGLSGAASWFALPSIMNMGKTSPTSSGDYAG